MQIAIIASHYINAYSIVVSLKKIGWTGKIVCVKDTRDKSVLTECFGKAVEHWSLDLSEPANLILAIKNNTPQSDQKYVFFCNEQFHIAFNDIEKYDIDNIKFTIGSRKNLDVLLNRYKLLEHFKEHNIGTVPNTIKGTENPFSVFGNEFFIRTNYSWRKSERLPRVKLIKDKIDFEKTVNQYKSIGLEPMEWAYQEKLSIKPESNVSVCGLRTKSTNLFYVTHHLLRHPNISGNGDLTGIIEDPGSLITITDKFLSSIDFEGPFELEFVLDERDNHFKVIEINPRFWMQHGLINANSDHALVRWCLGMFNSEKQETNPQYKYWINTIYATYRLLKLEFGVVSKFSSKNSIAFPNLQDTCFWIPRNTFVK